MTLTPKVEAAARSLVARRLGLSFPEQGEGELARRLLRACGTSTAAGIARCLARLESLPADAPEWRRFVSHLTVGETYFMRDPRCFAALETEVLPSLIRRRRREGTRRLRIWSAGCATGEEPYSLAIVLERLLPDRAEWSLTILGTDVNPEAVVAARQGVYREWSLRATPSEIRRRHFRRAGPGLYELNPAIREMVTFSPLNLAEDDYPSHATNTSAIDLILCRNVVMYFTRETQGAAAARFARALVEGGWLVVSPAEASAELLRPLQAVNVGGAILFRKVAAAPASLPRPHVRKPAPPPAASRRAPRQGSPAAVAAREQSQKPDGAGRLQHASAEADRGNLDVAKRLCLESIRAEPLDHDAYVLLAEIEQERGELAASVAAIRRAIYLLPDSAAAHFVLGSLLLRQGDWARARRSMETVVSLLAPLAPEETVAGADGLTAGRLRETAKAHLETW